MTDLFTVPAFEQRCARLPDPPVGDDAVQRVYGQKGNEREWFAAHMQALYLPPRLAIVWRRPTRPSVWVNRHCASAFQLVFDEIVAEGLEGLLPEFDGVYNDRPIRGGHRLSFHAYGAAIDLNAATNPHGHEGEMPERIVQIFETAKFTWGGRWRPPTKPDPMHFQWGRY